MLAQSIGMHLPYVASTLSFGGYIEVLCQHIPVRYGSLDKILAKADLVADPGKTLLIPHVTLMY